MEIDGFLDDNFCKEIVDKCDQDARPKEKGLQICRLHDWNEISDKLREYIKNAHERYIEWLGVTLPIVPRKIETANNVEFRIEKHDTGYDWVVPIDKNDPIFTFFIHLNDVDDDGETDFVYKKIKAKAGKLIMFPAVWTSYHMGSPCNNKYVIMGTFHLTP